MDKLDFYFLKAFFTLWSLTSVVELLYIFNYSFQCNDLLFIAGFVHEIKIKI
jgi:hypothetical protein